MDRKWKIPNIVLQRQTLCFSSYENHKLKIKLWWAGAHKRNKRAFFVSFIMPEENFSNICVLSKCIVYLVLLRDPTHHSFTFNLPYK